ncbi:MAG TPA: hypothetical protein VK492_09545 [Chitinophagaceae bacterium]|nr:hypothetical protein [Chitinophagaceae bacterium]
MEVHAHTHTARKKWTHYFWEFIMLFLAVFCGFLAEYKLEHIIEHQREEQYMRSMIEDLKADVLMLEKNVTLRKSRLTMIDSLADLLNSPQRDKYGNDIYFFARSTSPPVNIFPNDGTIQQLKSSGNLRLIRHNQIANSIMAYDQKMRGALFEMGDEVEVRAEYRQLARKLFNTNIFFEMIATDEISRPVNNPQLFINDAGLINEFIGQLQYVKRIHQAQLIRSEELLVQAKQLIIDIDKEYHLSEGAPLEK